MGHPHLARQPCDVARAVLEHVAEIAFAFRGDDVDAVHHRVGVRHGGTHRHFVANVAQDRHDLTDRAIGSGEQRLVGSADGDAHAPASLGHQAHDLSSDKSRAAENRDQFRHGLCASFMPSVAGDHYPSRPPPARRR